MNVLFITNGYPSVNTPSKTIFLQRLVHEIRDLGHSCYVIQPNPYPQALNVPNEFEEHTTFLGNKVYVYYPRYFRIWLTARVKYDLLKEITVSNYIDAVIRTIENNKLQFDVVYAHFLSTPTRCAIEIGNRYNVPVYAAAGESDFSFFNEPDSENTICYLNKLNGIVSVSSNNRKILLDKHILNKDRIRVFPNGVNRNVFFPHNHKESRKMFRFDEDDFVIGFTGHFIERKGPLRLQKATRDLDVKVAYAGRGEQVPREKNTIWAKPVTPEDMPFFLSACDIFVLPSIKEGCCNAIIEAMSCGLPIVSSKDSFNDDILDDKCSIRIDSMNCDEIRRAVIYLYQNKEKRNAMSEAAIEKAKSLSIKERAKKIMLWISNNMEVRN